MRVHDIQLVDYVIIVRDSSRLHSVPSLLPLLVTRVALDRYSFTFFTSTILIPKKIPQKREF